MATRGHVTGYGQLDLTALGRRVERNSSGPARGELTAPRQLTTPGHTLNVLPSRLGRIAIKLNKYRFGPNRAQPKP
jgi:hypothetical protein